MAHFEYGLKPNGIKEKALVKYVDEILEQVITNGEHNMYKTNSLRKQKPIPSVSFDKSKKKYVYDYTYFYTNKYWGFSCDLYPNKDKNGDIKYDIDGVEWILWLNYWPRHVEWDENEKSHPVDTTNPLAVALKETMINSLPCESVLLREYADGEER